MTINPGILTSIDKLKLEKEQWEIVQKLASEWLVTYADQRLIKTFYYSFVFLKPTTSLLADFPLDREVLAIFNSYKDVDARTLDVVDQILRIYKNRLDKLCVIIIGRDSDIKRKIRDRFVQDKESRIFIPFSYEEFLSPQFHKLSIRGRIREFMFERDFFDHSSPLKTENFFFGRNEEIQTLYGKYKSGENGSLFGLRRIGKTSTLHALQRQLELREEPAIIIDCSDTAFHLKRWNKALRYIIDRFIKYAETLGIGANIEPNASYTEDEASTCFEEDLLKLFHAFGDKRILIIFDEIGGISFGTSVSEHWANGKDFLLFWQSIRAVSQRHSYLFSFIIAGVNATVLEKSHIGIPDNPLYRLITPTYLRFFDIEDVREMVSIIGNYMGLRFEEELFTYLTDDFGGHPYLIRQICSTLHKDIKDLRPMVIKKFYYHMRSEELQKSIIDYIEQILEVLKQHYSLEYSLLENLASGDRKRFDELVQQEPLLVQHLEGYGLISETHGIYHFRIRSVEKFIQRESSHPQIFETDAERRAEIRKQQDRLEVRLRQVVKMLLKAKYGRDSKKQFLEIIHGDRRAKLDALNLDEIFESTKTEIYLDDLRLVIHKEWEVFQKVFRGDLETFLRNIKDANRKGRNPASHANPISEETYQEVMIAFRWLDSCIDEFMD